jgi:hypothetical protein
MVNLVLHSHREDSPLTRELPKESDQFLFLRVVCLTNLKDSVGLILTKVSVMRVTLPFESRHGRSYVSLTSFTHVVSLLFLLLP